MRGHTRCAGHPKGTSNQLYLLGDEPEERGREHQEGRLAVSKLHTRRGSTVMPGEKSRWCFWLS